MWGAFWEETGTTLAQRWAAAGAPAAVFWTLGALVWVLGHGPELVSQAGAWLADQPVTTQVGVLLMVLVVIGATAMLTDRATTPVLRLLEGYWPAWLDRCRSARIATLTKRDKTDQKALQALHSRRHHGGPLTPAESAHLARLDLARHHRPHPQHLMPTTVGNILRAAERRPDDKYGLDAVITWPRLWLVLPEATRTELAAARRALDTTVATVIWGAGFTLFAGAATWRWCWLPIVAGILLAITAARWWVPVRAATFADLVDATFDMHRHLLYIAMRWPTPTTPEQERQLGRSMTRMWWTADPGQDITLSRTPEHTDP